MAFGLFLSELQTIEGAKPETTFEVALPWLAEITMRPDVKKLTSKLSSLIQRGSRAVWGGLRSAGRFLMSPEGRVVLELMVLVVSILDIALKLITIWNPTRS